MATQSLAEKMKAYSQKYGISTPQTSINQTTGQQQEGTLPKLKLPASAQQAALNPPLSSVSPSQSSSLTDLNYTPMNAVPKSNVSKTVTATPTQQPIVDPATLQLQQEALNMQKYGSPNAPASVTSSDTVPPPAASTPTPVPTAAPTSQAENISALQRRVLESYAMTPQEQSAQEKLDALIAEQARIASSEDLGLRKIEGERMAMPFITGQSAQVQRQAAALQKAVASEAVPIQTQLARAQAERELSRQRAETELGYATPSQPIEVGGALVQYDPMTGQYTPVYQPPEKAQAPTQVAAGNALVDAAGNVIYQAQPKETGINTQVVKIGKQQVLIDKNTGETIKVLGIAGAEGGAALGGGAAVGAGMLSPSAEAVFNNPGLLQNYTPTERGKILNELAAAGQDLGRFAIEKIGASQRETLALFDEIMQEADRIAQQVAPGGVNTGPIASLIGKSKAALGFAPDFTELRSSIDNMQSILLRMRSGAAVTPQEYERIKGFVPNINDDEKTIATKVNRFYEQIRQAQENYANRLTQTNFEIQQSVLGGGSSGGQTSSGVSYTITEE